MYFALLLAILLAPTHAWAAFPIVQATNSTGDATNVTSHTVGLPASISSGDLLMAFISCRNSTSTIVFPGGWTQVGSDFNSGGVASGQTINAIYYRVANGGEGASITVTTSVSNACASVTKRITGQHASTAPEAGTAASGASVNPDPPNLAPSWGAEDTLWIAFEGNTAARTTSVYPYADNNLTVPTSSGANATIAYCEQSVNASSSDPGTFTISVSENWGAQTVAIRPAAVASDFGGEAIWFP
ncbi:MAG: hypothetical protein ABL983_01115 [Nitrospira sp.]